MVKVITYGTYDMLHHGHIRLLERAKALGDYLIVGVTSDDYDKTRGKINSQQTLMERIASIEKTGLADEIIVEEYEGQKIDDIRKHDIDIFTVGSDWEGKFDYLNEFCKVIYLPRTQGVSSSEIRAEKRRIRIGIVGDAGILNVIKKFVRESTFVNGCEVQGICFDDKLFAMQNFDLPIVTDDFEELLTETDAIYVASHPSKHYEHIKAALLASKHVLCESPIALSADCCDELFSLAKKNGCILVEAIKTAYSTAFSRLLLMIKGEKIGKVVSVDATCTSLTDGFANNTNFEKKWNSICAWGPIAMLPVFMILGTEYINRNIVSVYADKQKQFDMFTKIDFTYPNATATIKVGKGVKSEGEMIISGTKGYLYVPAPWWKTDYYELRYENQESNRRYFYQLDGEGIRYEIVAFIKAIDRGYRYTDIPHSVTREICSVIEASYKKEEVFEIEPV